MARELDIKGRSSMSRAKLEKAVAEASGASSHRRKAS
jgi:DNA end-binding protein Ku